MNNSAIAIGIIFVAALLSGLASFFISKFAGRFKRDWTVRENGEPLNAVLSEALERGDAAHVDLNGATDAPLSGVLTPALESANRIARRAAAADTAPIFSADSGFNGAVLEQAADSAYASVDLDAEYDPTTVRTAGNDALTHQGVMLTALDESHEPLHLSIGSAGAEIALQDLAFEANESLIVAGDNLQAQAIGTVCAEKTLIGDRVISLPALLRKYTKDADAEREIAFLLATDALRWILIGVLIAAVVLLRLFG